MSSPKCIMMHLKPRYPAVIYLENTVCALSPSANGGHRAAFSGWDALADSDLS